MDSLKTSLRQIAIIKISALQFVRMLITLFHLHKERLAWSVKRRGMPDKTIVVTHGSKMELDLLTDSGISHDLYFHGTREQASISYLLNNNIIKPGDIALDIGGNIGYYVLLESKLVGETGKVYALEPVKDSCDQLRKNIELNNRTNIETYNIAASDVNGTSNIHISCYRNWSSLVNTIPTRFSHTEKITTVTMDNFLNDKPTPNFIRMDVEGYEYAIVRGLKQTLLSQKRGAMLLEIHPNIMSKDQTIELFSLLEETGYTKVTVLHEPYRGWLNKKREIRPVIAWLTRLIGDTEKLIGYESSTLQEAQSLCIDRHKLLYALFEKT